MTSRLRIRRLVAMSVLLALLLTTFLATGVFESGTQTSEPTPTAPSSTSPAVEVLETLAVKGRAPKTDYSRAQFGDGWAITSGCDTRNIILYRDLSDAVIDATCNVTKGKLSDPYTGAEISFVRGAKTSDDVQIDHVVALSNAWQTGAQQLSKEQRIKLANDPLELLAVDGPANQQKSDGDAATWLPAHKPFRCQYVARQIAVKQKYSLWVTRAEYDAMKTVLSTCPGQLLPSK
jgi:hypothetical protein